MAWEQTKTVVESKSNQDMKAEDLKNLRHGIRGERGC